MSIEDIFDRIEDVNLLFFCEKFIITEMLENGRSNRSTRLLLPMIKDWLKEQKRYENKKIVKRVRGTFAIVLSLAMAVGIFAV